MLTPVTARYEDRSTERYFQFAFFCDGCGSVWESPRYTFVSHFRDNLSIISHAEKEARRMIWLRDHDAAYERANQELLRRFSQCSVCGGYVCDDCTLICHELDGAVCCVRCAKKNHYSGFLVGKTEEKRDLPVNFSAVRNEGRPM